MYKLNRVKKKKLLLTATAKKSWKRPDKAIGRKVMAKKRIINDGLQFYQNFLILLIINDQQRQYDIVYDDQDYLQ